MSEPIKCNLADNALDYLILAGEMAKEGSPRMVKHAMATLADGIELLVKARLEQYDWCLLFKDVDKAERSLFEAGDFQSVTFDQCVKRLKSICGVTCDHENFKVVGKLRKLRNQIRHFAITVDSRQAISIIAKAYGFAIDFVTKEIEPNVDINLAQDVSRLRSLLGDFDGFINERLKSIKSKLDEQDYSIHIQCPACLQDTLYPSAGEAGCAFCGYKREGEDAATDWVFRQHGPISPKDWLCEQVKRICPECGSAACIPNSCGDCDTKFVCLSCGESGDYEECTSCGELQNDANPGDMCDDCWERLLERND